VKWLGLILTLAAVLPLSGWLRHSTRNVPKIWTLIGFLPFVTDTFHLSMGGIAWSEWPSYVRGAEFWVIDAIALAIYLTLPGTARLLPFRIPMLLYFFAVAISAFQADVREVVFFYCWQLARTFFLCSVVANACSDARVAPAILKGMAAGLIMEAVIMIWQRFGLNMPQPTGNLVHQNLVGMISLFVTLPFCALLLTGRRGWLPAITMLAGCVVQVLTLSRGTIAIAGTGYLTMLIVSGLRQWTTRKAMFLLLVTIGLFAGTPLILSSIEQRAGNDIETSDANRSKLTDEAARVIADYPFGIGANQYVHVAQKEGYKKPDRDWGVMVHNVYLLVAAETGYFGLVTFLIYLLYPLVVAMRRGWQFRGDPAGDILLGIGMALLAVYLQGLFEFEFLEPVVQYIFALELGMVAGLARYQGMPAVSRYIDQNKRGRQGAFSS